MDASLIKETRALLPALVGTLLVIVLPFLIWGNRVADFGCVILGVACVVLAGATFGNEFRYRTIPLLLAQPIARSFLWRNKMLVLAASLVISLLVLAGCDLLTGAPLDLQVWLTLALVALCAFCGAPCWTLLVRHELAGMAVTVGAPVAIYLLTFLVFDWLPGPPDPRLMDLPWIIGISFVVLYCGLACWGGYAQFLRLQDVEHHARELALPANVQTALERPLARAFSRFRGPFAALLKKEFRLQQASFLVAGLFTLIAVAGFCLFQRYAAFAKGVMGGDFVVYMLILPCLAGALSVAEERASGIAPWHLTLPPSARQQWTAKMLAALPTGLGLGLLLPAALVLAGAALLGQFGPVVSLPTAPDILCWLLGSLLATSVAMYAASFSSSTLRAILAAFAISGIGLGVFLWLASKTTRIFAPAGWYLQNPAVQSWWHSLIALSIIAGLFILLCLVQGLACSNFRRSGPSAATTLLQLLTIFLVVALLVLVIPAILYLSIFRPHFPVFTFSPR